MKAEKSLAGLVSTVALACFVATGQASFTKLEVMDNLRFLDKLNPFEQQDTFLYTNRNENNNRSYFQWMGVSLNLVGYGTFVNQTGDASSDLVKYNSQGSIYNLFVDSEFHPIENLDVSLGFRVWRAEAGHGNLKHYATGLPLVAKVVYDDQFVKASLEVGFDFFKSFSMYKEQKQLYVDSNSKELEKLADQISYLAARNFHMRATLALAHHFEDKWWVAGTVVFGLRAPLPYVNPPKTIHDAAAYKKVIDFTKRNGVAVSFQLQNGRSLGGSFPFADWSFAHYLSFDLEVDHYVGENTHGRSNKVGFSYGFKLRAVLPYVTFNSSLGFKLLDKRQSVNFSLQFNVSQW